jgi:hypothetical protein
MRCPSNALREPRPLWCVCGCSGRLPAQSGKDTAIRGIPVQFLCEGLTAWLSEEDPFFHAEQAQTAGPAPLLDVKTVSRVFDAKTDASALASEMDEKGP